MLRESILDTLNIIFAKGLWERQSDLMGEVLSCFPRDFSGLREADALRIIEYANKFLDDYGEVPIPCMDYPGKCVDLWDNMEAPKNYKQSTFKPLKFGNDSSKADGKIPDNELPCPTFDELYGIKEKDSKSGEHLNFGTITGRVRHVKESPVLNTSKKDQIKLNMAEAMALVKTVETQPMYERWVDINSGREMLSKTNSKGEKVILKITPDLKAKEFDDFISEES